MKAIVPLPLKSFCGLEFGNRSWSKHLYGCPVCQEEWPIFKEKEEKRERDSWKEPCACGCGGIAAFHKRYINGHGHRVWTSEQKRCASERIRLNHPMRSEAARRKNSEAQKGVPRPWQVGDLNPAKRESVRALISLNNPMKNCEVRSRQTSACRTDSERQRRSTFMHEHSCQYDPKVVARRVDTYTRRLAEGRYHLKNNWKTGFYDRKDGLREWYDSSYELDRMKYYDAEGVVWTKKHKIRMAYVSADGRPTFYVPDFLVVMADGQHIIDEIKGWVKESDVLKAKVAIEFCHLRGWLYRFFLGKEMILQPELSHLGVT